MKMSDLREFVSGEGVKQVEVEFDSVRYAIKDMMLDRQSGTQTLVLIVERFDEIDETGLTGEDLYD